MERRGSAEGPSLTPGACNSLADNENLARGGDAPGSCCSQPPGVLNKMRVRSAHRAEGRRLSLKSPRGVQQGLIALPSPSQFPGCQGWSNCQAGGGLEPSALPI